MIKRMPAPFNKPSTFWVYCMLCLTLSPGYSLAQDVRWYQVEISIFTQENFFPDIEIWESDPPEPFAGTRDLVDLSHLPLAQWEALETPPPPEPVAPASPATAPSTLPERTLVPSESAPEDLFVGPPDPPLPDIRREPFITLPPSQHDFRDTVRTLERSPNHRVLFHAAWRQPIRQPARSTAVAVSGGQLLGNVPELRGSVRFRFNPGEDRVVVDARLLLTRFDLPDLPISISQSRDMRSNEFHFIDHPALGIVVQVKPYAVPPPDEEPPLVTEQPVDF